MRSPIWRPTLVPALAAVMLVGRSVRRAPARNAEAVVRVTPSSEGAEVWGSRQGWALATVCLFGAAVGSNFTNHAPLIPILTAALDFGPAQAGLVSSALFVTVAIGQVAGGPLCDRHGAKLVGAGGLLLAALATWQLAWAGGLLELIAFKTLAGLGTGVGFSAGARYSGVFFSAGRKHLTVGLCGGCIVLGGGLAIYGMPLLAEALDWRGAFVAAALMCGTVAALWACAPGAVGGQAANPLDAAGQATTWLLGVVNLTTCSLGFVVGTWITVYLVAELGLSLVAAGAIGSTVLALGVVTRPVGGALIRRRLLTTRGAMRLSLLLNLVGLAAMALPGRPLSIAVLAILLLGVGVNLPFSAIYTTAPASLPSAPGAALGLVAGIGILGSVPAAAVVGWLYELSGGFSVPFAALGVMVLGGCWAALVVRGEEEYAQAP